MARLGAIGTFVVSIGCGAPANEPLPAPIVSVGLEAPWQLVEQTDAEVLVRLGDGPDGVRVQLLHQDGRIPGVSPIHGGRTLETQAGGEVWPLVAVAYPDVALSSVDVEVQGIDLVARFQGQPLSTVSDHPDAPQDPVLTWVRIRRRPADWRVVLDGLGTVSVPEAPVALAEADGWRIGDLTVTTTAPRYDSGTGRRWWLSVVPSLEAIEPYPRTSLTLTP